MPWMLIPAAISAGVAIYGAISSAQEKEDAAKRQQALVEGQIDEMRTREAINERIMRQKNTEQEGWARVQAAAMGGGGMGIAQILRNRSILEENISLARRELNYKSEQARIGAQIQTDLYSSGVAAAYLQGAGILAQTAGRAAMDYNQYGAQNSKASDLPKGT